MATDVATQQVTPRIGGLHRAGAHRPARAHAGVLADRP